MYIYPLLKKRSLQTLKSITYHQNDNERLVLTLNQMVTHNIHWLVIRDVTFVWYANVGKSDEFFFAKRQIICIDVKALL